MPKAGLANKIGLVASNQLLLEACVFIRNIIIARFLGAESLGEFIFLILAIRLFAMSTDLATERYIIQADKKDLKSALACSHFIAQTRGLGLAAMLLLMGLHNVHGISFFCYALLAGSALIRGFTHQGYRLKQRSLNFRPALYVEGSTMLIGTFAIYIVVAIEPCLEVVCACMLAQAAMHTSLSHIMSDEKYTAESDSVMLKTVAKYGFPLLLTSVTMFWSMQGERVILSAVMPSDAFAHFSMLFQLALVPALVIGRIALSLGLPWLAQKQSNMDDFTESLSAFHVLTYGVMILFFLSFVLLSNPVLTILFGADFKAEMTIVFLVGLAQSLRLCRTPQSVAAQALAHTDIPFKANIIRVLAAITGALLVTAGGSLTSLLITACIGEGLAWVAQAILYSLRTRSKPEPTPIKSSSNFREAT